MPTENSVLPEKILLRPVEAAALLAISPRKLWDLTRSGHIRAVRIGRAVRYAIDDLRRWVAEQR